MTASVSEPQVPEPGSSYHHLARTQSHHWSRPVAELLMLLVGWFVIAGVIAVILPGEIGSVDGALGLLTIGLGLASAIPGALFAARVMGRAPGMVSSVIGRVRWRWLAWCSAVFAIAMIVSHGVLVVVEQIAPTEEVPGARAEVWPGLATFAWQSALILLIVPFQAAGEEYAIRGTLLQALGSWVRPAWFSIAITTLVFAAMHAPEGAAVWLAMISTGIVTAWLTIRTGGLEAAIAVHAASNVFGFTLDAATGGFAHWAKDLNTSVPLTPVIVIELGLALAAIFVARRARRIGLQTSYIPPPAP